MYRTPPSGVVALKVMFGSYWGLPGGRLRFTQVTIASYNCSCFPFTFQAREPENHCLSIRAASDETVRGSFNNARVTVWYGCSLHQHRIIDPSETTIVVSHQQNLQHPMGVRFGADRDRAIANLLFTFVESQQWSPRAWH